MKPDQTFPLSLADIFAAAGRIAPLIIRTPLIGSPHLAAGADLKGTEILLKLECLQNTGAFKLRGAANAVLSLSKEERRRGVITFSTGNHGKAVACAARYAGIKAVVCVSERVPEYRAERIREFGAEVCVKGKSQDEAEENYYTVMKERGMVPIVPFDDLRVIAGQGTIALEMLSDRPDLEVILAPVSGGGLISGTALAAKAVKPEIRVIGVSIERSPAMLESLKAGRPVPVEERDSLADSLLGGIGVENRFTLSVIRDLVDEHVIVTEEELAEGMRFALCRHILVVEGAAAAGIAAVLSGKVPGGKKTGIIVTGSSVDIGRYLEVVEPLRRG